MDEQRVLQSLSRIGAVIKESHIVYSAGQHGSEYVNKDAIYPHTELTSSLCRLIAEEFQHENPEAVIAPAVGGVILSQWVAHHLTQLLGYQVWSVYADKDAEQFIIKRGYDKLVSAKNVLVVEDVLNSGGSVEKVVRAVRAIGGNPIGVGALCNRGGVTSEMIGRVPKLYSLVNVTMQKWEESNCPFCEAGTPINTEVGHGREFLARAAIK